MKKQIKRKIYLLSNREMKPIEVVQYETGVQLVFEIQDIELDTTATATLFVRKPSGKFVFQEDGISLTGNTVVIDLHNQAITEYGKPFFQIKFKKDEETISTYSGMMTVDKSLDDSGAEESKTFIAAFDKLTEDEIAKIEEATRTQIDLMKAEVEAKGKTVLATIPDEYTEMYNRVNTLFSSVANAIKGTVSGSVVRADDVSPVEHTANVKVRGKNLFHFNTDYSNAYNGIEIKITKDQSVIVANGTTTDAQAFSLTSSILELEAGTYTISTSGLSLISDVYDRIYLENLIDGIIIGNYIQPDKPKTFVLTKKAEIKITIVFGIGTSYNNAEIGIQIEEGDTATEYTPYIDPTTVTVTADGVNYTPEADGTVSGIPSTALSGGISTDNENVTIECEYIKDTGKVIEKLTNAVVALGGAV